MYNIEQLLAAASRILALRAQLAQAEAEFRGEEPGTPPSTSQRVLHLVRDAGPEGVDRQAIRAIVQGQDGAVTAALKAHSKAGRMQNKNNRWVAIVPKAAPVAVVYEETRPMRPIAQ